MKNLIKCFQISCVFFLSGVGIVQAMEGVNANTLRVRRTSDDSISGNTSDTAPKASETSETHDEISSQIVKVLEQKLDLQGSKNQKTDITINYYTTINHNYSSDKSNEEVEVMEKDRKDKTEELKARVASLEKQSILHKKYIDMLVELSKGSGTIDKYVKENNTDKNVKMAICLSDYNFNCTRV